MVTRLITAPTILVVPLNEMKLHLKEELDDNDALIEALTHAARELAEQRTKRSFLPTVWEQITDGFSPVGHVLDWPTLISIESVKYLDQNGSLQAVPPSDYQMDNYNEPGIVLPAYGMSWPTTQTTRAAVRIRYRAGYEDATQVPEAAKLWIKLAVTAWYENRSAIVTGSGAQVLPRDFGGSLLDRLIVWG